METAVQEFIFQGLFVVISVLLAIAGAYVKKWVTQKIDIEKYGFENDKLERIIDNAVNYAEGVGRARAKEAAESTSKYLSGYQKLEVARGYINTIDPAIIRDHGRALDGMISRKVEQVFGAKD